MTLQLAMFGSDGVVLASDTLRCFMGKLRASENAQKIVIESVLGLAYASSGDDCAREIGSNLTARLTPGETLSNGLLLDVGNQTLSRFARKTNSKKRNLRGKLIIVQSRGKVGIKYDVGFGVWTLEYSQGKVLPSGVPRTQGKGHAWAGDEANSAQFFIEWYYRGMSLMPVESLKKMAAHTILMGGKLNPTGVEGLQIVSCKDGVFTEVEEKERASLEVLSVGLDNYICQQFGCEKPE